jgi:hypothetical protein
VGPLSIFVGLNGYEEIVRNKDVEVSNEALATALDACAIFLESGLAPVYPVKG